MFAIELGELLKYDTTLNEIGRAANGLFAFEQEEFPIDSITSSRAHSIYNWMMTLGKQRMNPEKRLELLANFSGRLPASTRRRSRICCNDTVFRHESAAVPISQHSMLADFTKKSCVTASDSLRKAITSTLSLRPPRRTTNSCEKSRSPQRTAEALCSKYGDAIMAS